MVPDPVNADSCKADLDFFSFGLLRLRRSFRGKVCGAYFGEFSTARENVKSATGRGLRHRGCHSCQGGSSGDDDDLELGADSPDSGRFFKGKNRARRSSSSRGGAFSKPVKVHTCQFPRASLRESFPTSIEAIREGSKQSGSANFDSPPKTRTRVCVCVALAVCV